MIALRNIEFIYHGSYIEYVKDGNPNKPPTPSEIKACDEIVERIKLLAKKGE